MPRTPWTTYTGNDIEAYAAMCIYRERPNAVRIRPSVGDGGIDVYVLVGDNLVDIYQVKKYAQNLSKGQLGEIKKSYNTVKKYTKQRQWQIATWYLVMPLDPTRENDQWLEDLNKGDAFKAVWRGLPVFDNWAIEYPQALDHFFNGGRDQLAAELARFTNTTSITLPGVDLERAQRSFAALEPIDVIGRLGLLNATLNAGDPFYQYEISVGSKVAQPPYTSGGYPALVASYSRVVADQTVTVHVLARFAESTVERPITFNATVVVPRGGEEEKEWQQFLEYGRPPSKPLTVRQLVSDLPGGLGHSADEAMMIIKPVDDRNMSPLDRDFLVLSPSGDTIARAAITFTESGSNSDNTGTFMRGTNRSGMLTIEVLSKTNGDQIDMTYNFNLADDAGRHPADVLAALEFTNAFFAPNTLKVVDPRVPRIALVHPLSAKAPEGKDGRFADQYVVYIRALQVVQEYADREILVPDPASMDENAYVAVMRAARLLAGEVVEFGWDAVTVTLALDAPPIDDDQPHALVADLPFRLRIGNQHVALGMVRYHLEAAQVGSRSVAKDGGVKVVFRPALGKTKVKAIWAGVGSLEQV